MTNKNEINADVSAKEPYNLESAFMETCCDGLTESYLESKGYRIISLEENAKLRMQEGKDAFISQNSNWTKEDVVYLDSGEIYLTKSLPKKKIELDKISIFDAYELGKSASNTLCMRRHTMGSKGIENAMENAVKFPKNVDYKIPTDRFGEDEITDFAFGKIAKDYGKFLKEAGINEMPIKLVDNIYRKKEQEPYALKLMFEKIGPINGSDLNGFILNPNLYTIFRGVREAIEGKTK